MLNILGMIILIIILIIIIILLTGLKISLEYNKKGSEVKGCLKILVLKKIKIYSTTFPDTSKKEDEDRDRNIKDTFDLLKPCLNDFKNYLKSVINIIKITKIENHLIFGMTSYADTGKYIGIIWAILSMINSMNEKLHLSAEPSFNGSVFDGYGVNEVEVYPLKLIVPTLRLLLKKEVRIFIRGVLDAR